MLRYGLLLLGALLMAPYADAAMLLTCGILLPWRSIF